MLVSLLVISCDREEFNPEFSDINFDLPQYVYVGEQLDLTYSSGEFNKVIWEIGNHENYSGFLVSYTFDKPGDYKIKLTVFKDQLPAGSISKTLTVLTPEKAINSNNPFRAIRGFAANNNRVILEGYFTGTPSDKILYLVLDYKLNCIDTLDYNGLISEGLIDAISINDNFYSFSTLGTNPLDDFNSSQFISGSNSNGRLMSYSDGYINYRFDERTGFVLDYYNKELTKLWSKYFPATSLVSFLFNLNEKLYYIYFDKGSDVLFIENFKNISLSYCKVEYPIENLANDISVLFAIKNPAWDKICVGIYSREKDMSYIFDIDANCNLTLRKSIPGKFNKKIQFTVADGSIIACSASKIYKYSGDWDLQNEITIGCEEFGICTMASNLLLIFKNTSNGITFRYVDKHLNDVTLD